MIRVLVMTESLLLADAIASNLAQDANLRILRLTRPDPGRTSEAVREDCSILIIIEEKESNHRFFTAGGLLQNCSCFRTITASLRKHHLYIWDSDELPISGMIPTVNLARGFPQEYRSEVAG